MWFGFLILLVGISTAGAQSTIIFEMKDPAGDDWGAGALAYPGHEIFSAGLFDLQKFRVSADETHFYFDFQFPAVTNPFQAPEGYFHQRLEVYMDTSFPGGNENIILGGWRLRTRPQYGWEVRLSVAPFNETRLFTWDSQGLRQYDQGVSSSLQADGKTIRAKVERGLLAGQPECRRWRYYVLVGSFDGLSPGSWRPLGDNSLWQAGGEGPPVFDLLAPRWGWKTQKRQLARGVLSPVSVAGVKVSLWIKIGLISLLGIAVLFGAAYHLRRWNNDGA